jgi:hypothetical protein
MSWGKTPPEHWWLLAIEKFGEGDASDLVALVAEGVELPEPLLAKLGSIVLRAGSKLPRIATLLQPQGRKETHYTKNDALCLWIADEYQAQLAKGKSATLAADYVIERRTFRYLVPKLTRTAVMRANARAKRLRI